MPELICHLLPPCARRGCGRPACDHDATPETHPIPGVCEGYLLPEGQSLGEFVPGGGSGGGGGASGSW